MLLVSLPQRGWEKLERVTAGIDGISVMETDLEVRDCDGCIPFMWWREPFLALSVELWGIHHFHLPEERAAKAGVWELEIRGIWSGNGGAELGGGSVARKGLSCCSWSREPGAACPVMGWPWK